MADTFIDDLDWITDELITSTKFNQWWANMQNFHNGTALGDGIIVTRHHATSAVTTPKMKPTTILLTAPQSGSYSNSTTTWTDIYSWNYTSGATAERLILEGGCLTQQATSGNANVRLQVNGVAGTREAYVDTVPQHWENVRVFDIFDIPANTTVTIKLQGKVSAGTMTVSFGGIDANHFWGPHVTGLVISNA
jgi:hypothetical protein